MKKRNEAEVWQSDLQNNWHRKKYSPKDSEWGHIYDVSYYPWVRQILSKQVKRDQHFIQCLCPAHTKTQMSTSWRFLSIISTIPMSSERGNVFIEKLTSIQVTCGLENITNYDTSLITTRATCHLRSPRRPGHVNSHRPIFTRSPVHYFHARQTPTTLPSEANSCQLPRSKASQAMTFSWFSIRDERHLLLASEAKSCTMCEKVTSSASGVGFSRLASTAPSFFSCSSFSCSSCSW